MRRLVLSSVLIALLAAGHLHAAGCPAFNPSDLGQVDLTVSLSGSAPILPRLPILVRVTVTNHSGASVDVPPLTPTARDEGFATLDLFTAPGSDPLRAVALASPSFGPSKEGLVPAPPDLLHLGPGASASVDLPLTYDWDVDSPRSLVEAGSLQISALLYGIANDASGNCHVDQSVSAASPVLVVSVPTPSGDDVSALSSALALLNPWLLAHPAALRNVRLGSDFTALQNLASNHPSTTYALYANAVLAYANDVGDDLDPSPSRPPDRPTALALTNQVLADARFVLRPELLDLQARLAIEGP